MRNRSKRVEAIIKILESNNISSQEQLVAELEKRGFKATQATLSRDLKLLKTIKVPTERGQSVYVLPDIDPLKERLLTRGHLRSSANFSSGFVSIEFSGNMAVIKTRNGYAAGLAFDIDYSETPEILGTIPGADTIFAVLREGVSHEEARRVFARFFPQLRDPKEKPAKMKQP